MAAKSPVQESTVPCEEPTSETQLSEIPSNHVPVKPDILPPTDTVTPQPLPPSTSLPTPTPSLPAPSPTPTPQKATSQLPQIPTSSDADTVHIPSYSRWFSWDNINECEVRLVPEFFDSRAPSKNPRVYIYIRNSIIKQFRENSPRKITFTDVRRNLLCDVGSIRRVFDFLDNWGLINYSGSALAKPLKWDDKESKSSADSSAGSPATVKETVKRTCNGCKSVCTIACFRCEKYDLTLCARCYVRGNYRVGVSSSEFKRVEISEDTSREWTDKETLQLMEAVMHYGDDWRKVAQHVTGRSERDCITHFIKLPFGEEYMSRPDSLEVDKLSQLKESENLESPLESVGTSSPSKRMCLTPLADASNPIMAQAAFLSALSGVDVAEATARAATATVSDIDYQPRKGGLGSHAIYSKQKDADSTANGDNTPKDLEGSYVDANSKLENDEMDVERAISEIIEVKMMEIKEKIARFEELDLQMEKERQELEQMKNMLFIDQLNILSQKSSAVKDGEHAGLNNRIDV